MWFGARFFWLKGWLIMNAMQATKFLNITPPAAIVDNASWTTAEIDTLGWDFLQILVIMGATDIAMTALAVTQSDASGSGHANITGLVWGTSTNADGSASVLPSATDDDKIQLAEIDLRGKKRYIDVTGTGGDGSAGAFLCILAILSRAKDAPVTAAERGCDEILRA